MLRFNLLLVTDAHYPDTASRRMLRAGDVVLYES
jgi:hypothetical protein